MVKGVVNRILPFSSVDGPGNRSVVFLQGCNYNCLYCHNPETIRKCNCCGSCIAHCPTGAISTENGGIKWDKTVCQSCDYCLKICNNQSTPKATLLSASEVMEEVAKWRNFISGITISGGECTLQDDFVIALCTEARKLGLTAFLDTNGATSFRDRKELAEAMDMAMLDVKSYDSKEHKMLTGMDNNIVLDNLEYLASVGKLYEVRTVVVPEILNNFNNIDMISRLIASLDNKIMYKLIKFRPVGVRSELKHKHSPSDGLMSELLKLAKRNGCENILVV